MSDTYAVVCEKCGPVGVAPSRDALTAAADQHVAEAHGGPVELTVPGEEAR